jgi:prevent-host-death family protein
MPRLELQNMRIFCIIGSVQEIWIMPTNDAITVTSAEFHRNIGTYQDVALTKTVTITKNGRERTVLISAEEYARLKRRDRRVIATGELTDRQIAALREAKVPDQHADLDRELKDWKP